LLGIAAGGASGPRRGSDISLEKVRRDFVARMMMEMVPWGSTTRTSSKELLSEGGQGRRTEDTQHPDTDRWLRDGECVSRRVFISVAYGL
jgi:hypothetical protein